MLTEVDLDCSPSYDPPTFAAIYDNVFEKRCASSQSTGCHGPDSGGAAGLVLLEPDEAFAHLIGDADGRARVVPEHPECSELVRRIRSKDAAVRMPYMAPPLDDGAICAIELWIAAGAEGP